MVKVFTNPGIIATNSLSRKIRKSARPAVKRLVGKPMVDKFPQGGVFAFF
jgi:hypothetical protein